MEVLTVLARWYKTRVSTTLSLSSGNYYHIYNRGNNRENLFMEKRNYPYFMRLYERYVSPVGVTFAYCLLRNHFHFLLRIEDRRASALSGDDRSSKDCPPFKPSRAFSNLFSTYAKAINKAYARTGSLFEKPFERVAIRSDAQLTRLVLYIHLNPQAHGFVDDFRDWPYSSYHVIRSSDPTWLARSECVDLFGGIAGFESAHP